MSDETVEIPEVIVYQNGDHTQGSEMDVLEPNGDATVEEETNTQALDDDRPDVQVLTSKLTAALKEIINKDNLVKQHAKVAEDAISGWEKAEAEAVMLKQHFENAQQQKLALDERVAHLDGALKECVKQLRSGREEQEQKQAESEEKAKEWDRVRFELEARLAEAEQEILAASNKNVSLEQRIVDAKVQTEQDGKKTSSKVEILEKENAALKHDVRALKKDLVGLNSDSKKASEVAKQQLLDSSRKVSRLEADCQRLKVQLRKKSTGSVREVDMLDRRKSLGRLVSSPRVFSEAGDDCSEMSTKETDEKWFALEEETKVLKGELGKRNKELQAARIMCARTASKLLNAEEKLDVSKMDLNGDIEALRAFGNSQQHGSCNGEDADVWASALVTELAQFKKEAKTPEKLLDTTSFELMDDFLEMEKLTSNVVHENGQVPERKDSGSISKKDLDVAAPEDQAHVANGHGQSPEAAEVQKEKLRPLIRKVLQTLELLGQHNGLEHDQQPLDLENNTDEIISHTKWEESSVCSSFEKLAASGNALLQGSTDFYAYFMDVCNTVDVLTTLQRNQTPDVERESPLVAATGQVASLQEELAREQETVATLRKEKDVLLDSLQDNAAKHADVLEELTLKSEVLQEKLSASTIVIEQLNSKIAALEDDAKMAEEKSREQVAILSVKFEEGLKKEICAREMAEKKLETVNGVVTELKDQNQRMDEKAKAQLTTMELLESELKRGRHDKLATQKDIDAVNQDIQKLMADFVQLQHEKQDLEEALAEAARQRLDETNRTNMHLQTIERLEEDLGKLLENEHESQKSIEEAKLELNKYLLREEAVHKALSEKEARYIELELFVDTLKAEKTSLEQKAKEQLKLEQGRVNSLQDDIGSLELQNVRLEGKLCQSAEDLKAQEEGFISLQTEFYQLKIEKEEMEHNFSQNVQQLNARIATLEEDCKRLKAEQAEMQDGYMQDVERAKGDFSRSDTELKEVRTEKERLFREVEDLGKIVEEMSEKCLKLESEVLALRGSNNDTKQELETATENLRRLEEECSRLESEKMDLEHLLAATNEIVQGVKEECSRLSTVEQELKDVKADREEMEEGMKQITQDLRSLEADKAELEHDLALSQVTWKSQVFEGEEVVASLRAELALSAKSRQLAEEQLAEMISSKAELQYDVKAAVHAANQLEERTKALEEELAKERSKSRAAAAELDDLLHQQLSGTKTSSPAAATPDPKTETNVELAAKLDECHRAILNLGEQLHSLSMSKSCQSPTLPEPSSSEESINNIKLKPEEPESVCSKSADQSPELPVEHSEKNSEAKVFVPSLPLEGRPRSKSTSPAKSKLLKAAAAAAAASANKELDLTKSLDMGSPSEKPSSSAFSRFFRGKSSSSSHHHP